MAPPLVVRIFQIHSKRSLLGKSARTASFECPHCKTKLVAKDDEISKPDNCPSCGGAFILAKEAAEKLRRLIAAEEEDARLQADAEEKQREESAAAKRREQETATARQREYEANQANAQRQQNSTQQLAEAKTSFRNYDIRQYFAMETIAAFFNALMWLVVVFEVLFLLISFFTVVFDFRSNSNMQIAGIFIMMLS